MEFCLSCLCGHLHRQFHPGFFENEFYFRNRIRLDFTGDVHAQPRETVLDFTYFGSDGNHAQRAGNVMPFVIRRDRSIVVIVMQNHN